ncbi:hypothetical protein EDC04DRAFT_2569019, partial [Pisolithus marmoratus]
VQCDNRYCKFSSTHPSTCIPPGCTNSCWQYRQFPQQYSEYSQWLCSCDYFQLPLTEPDV